MTDLLRMHCSVDHPNVDELLASGTHYDSADHPKVAPYLFIVPEGQQCIHFENYVPATGGHLNVSLFHPSVDGSIAAGTEYPADHPAMDALLRPYMSAGHRNVDDLMRAGTPLPVGHPVVDDYLCNEIPKNSDKVRMCASHADIDSMLAADAGPYSFPTTHPTVQPLLAAFLPYSKCIVTVYYLSAHSD